MPEELRKKLEVQLGTEITLSKVTLIKFEGQSEKGCPEAWWVIRCSPKDKKYSIVFKIRPGHTCNYACIVIAIVQYKALTNNLAARTYKMVTAMTTMGLGIATERRKGL